VSYESLEWLSRINCAGVDVNIFYEAKYANEAKSFCSQCEVRDECLSAAIYFDTLNYAGTPYGTWGGLTATERSELKRERKKVA
jgi:hypothetical protein